MLCIAVMSAVTPPVGRHAACLDDVFVSLIVAGTGMARRDPDVAALCA